MGIFGTTDILPDNDTNDKDYLVMTRFQAPESGTVTQISVYFQEVPVNVYASIYNDNGSIHPTNPLGISGPLAVSAGWVDFTGLNVPIVGGNYYWLCYEMDSNYGAVAAAVDGSHSVHYYLVGFGNHPDLTGVSPDITGAYDESIYATYSLPAYLLITQVKTVNVGRP